MNEAKLEAYKAKEQAKYVSIFRQGQNQFNACVATFTKKACEWIEFDINNYKLTSEATNADAQLKQKVALRDQDIRAALEDLWHPIKHSEADFIKASKFKFTKDMEMMRKMASLKYTTSAQQQAEIQAIEFSKISDALVIEFGEDFDLTYLIRGV